jgi:hypothetical protein
VILEDNSLLVAFDTDSGALTRMINKSTHWTMEQRPELGFSFRLHAPLPDRRDKFVLGQKQRAVEVKKISANQVHLLWRNLVSEHGGVLPMAFGATVTLTSGTLGFQGELNNDSALAVETVEYPCFGDFNSPASDTPIQVCSLNYASLTSREIYPHFDNDKGYWGVDFPTMTSPVSDDPQLFLIQAPREGLYVQIQNPNPIYLLQFTFEQHPGVLESIKSTVLKNDEIAGQRLRLELRLTHFIFAHPHSTVVLMPIVMRNYQGDWHSGIDLYKEWRAT